MLAYRNYIDLESTNLTLTLPQHFVGKKIEIIILENSENGKSKVKNNGKKPKLEIKPHKVGLLDPNWVWSREDCYD